MLPLALFYISAHRLTLCYKSLWLCFWLVPTFIFVKEVLDAFCLCDIMETILNFFLLPLYYQRTVILERYLGTEIKPSLIFWILISFFLLLHQAIWLFWLSDVSFPHICTKRKQQLKSCSWNYNNCFNAINLQQRIQEKLLMTAAKYCVS